MMEKNEFEKSNSEIKIIKNPDWKEIYMDGANIFIDSYAVRISCFSHIPNFSGDENVERVQKADLVMSRNALKELVQALNDVLNDMEKAEKEGEGETENV